MLAPGTIVAGYEIGGVLGEGGMGVVYEARQISLDRTVALKFLTVALGDDLGFRERFRREGLIQAAIDHPHIVAVYEAGQTEHGLFLAMRLVRGMTLKQLIAAGELDVERTLRILTPVADALDTAHAAGLIHRDVKPHNILVGSRDHAYLADFGLTRGPSGDGLTRTGQFVGTLDYVSPEQISGERGSARSDVYALAAVLFECLTSRVPFQRDSEPAKLFAHMSEPPPLVSELCSGLPKRIDEVIARAMAKQPDERHASAGDLMREAERALADAVRRRSRTVSVQDTPAPDPEATGTESDQITVAPDTSPGATRPAPAAVSDGTRTSPESSSDDPPVDSAGPAAGETRAAPPAGHGTRAPAGQPTRQAPGTHEAPATRAREAPATREAEAVEDRAQTDAAASVAAETTGRPTRAAQTRGSAQAPRSPTIASPPSSGAARADPAPASTTGRSATGPRQRATATRGRESLPWEAEKRASRDVGTARPSAAREPRRRVSGIVAGALLTLGVVLAAAVGVLAGRSGREESPTAEMTRTVEAGGVEISFSTPWQRVPELPNIRGVRFESAVALRRAGAGGSGQLVAGLVAAEGPALLPDRFAEQLDSRPRRDDVVRLGENAGYRHRNLRLDGAEGPIELLLVPTTGGVATIACLPPPRADAAFLPACERIASTLTLPGVRAYPLGPSPSLARTLSTTIKEIAGRVRSGRTRLREIVRSRRAQAEAATGISTAYARGAVRLAGLRVSPADRPARDRIVDGLRDARDAYRRLATAARSGSRRAFRTARTAIVTAEEKVRAGVRSLERLGYAVG